MTELNNILGNSVEKYQYLINNIADVIAEIDLNGILTYISPQVHKMFGYKPEELIGAKFFNYIHPQDVPSIIDAIEKTINSEDSFSIEYRVRHTEGHYVNVLANSSLVKVENNLKIIGVLKDITEKKLAEQKLKESEETFKKIINQSFMGIVIIQDLSIKYINETVTKMLGYSFDEMINWSINDLLNAIHMNDRTIAKERLERKQGSLYTETSYTYRMFTKTGDLRWIEIYTKQIYYQGKDSILTTLMDVTERGIAEQKLREINQLKSELLERTSHELKTPLISIKGFTDLLLDLHKEKFDTDTVSILDEIKQGTEQLEMTINKLLETSQLASGKLDFKPTQDDLSFLIKFCAKNLRGLANMRNHFISLDIPEKLILKFEKEKLYEVVSHLIINAIKYTPPFGEIKIRSEINDDYIIVSVNDNGIGLTENE